MHIYLINNIIKYILDASQYAQYVFNTIKRNQTGKISFEVIHFSKLYLPSWINQYIYIYEYNINPI